MNVVFIINNLNRAGAETALVRLALALHQRGERVSVITLTEKGDLAPQLEAAGIQVFAAGISASLRLPLALAKLVRLIRNQRPDVIHTWLYHSNLIGGFSARLAAPRTPVVWGIHHTILKAESSRRTTRMVSRVSGLLSRFIPRRITYVGESSRSAHEKLLYAHGRGVIIPNGVDVERFEPNQTTHDRVRQELGIPTDAEVIGIVARWHPDKDIPTFIQACSQLAQKRPRLHVVLAGSQLDDSNPELNRLIENAGLTGRAHLLGPRSDIPDVLCALNIAALSSITEAFPVSIIEAMAVAVPFVSTDVGDARSIIGAAGKVVPVGNPSAMSTAFEDLLDMQPAMRVAVGETGRARVKARFQLDQVVEMHVALYRSLT